MHRISMWAVTVCILGALTPIPTLAAGIGEAIAGIIVNGGVVKTESPPPLPTPKTPSSSTQCKARMQKVEASSNSDGSVTLPHNISAETTETTLTQVSSDCENGKIYESFVADGQTNGCPNMRVVWAWNPKCKDINGTPLRERCTLPGEIRYIPPQMPGVEGKKETYNITCKDGKAPPGDLGFQAFQQGASQKGVAAAKTLQELNTNGKAGDEKPFLLSQNTSTKKLLDSLSGDATANKGLTQQQVVTAANDNEILNNLALKEAITTQEGVVAQKTAIDQALQGRLAEYKQNIGRSYDSPGPDQVEKYTTDGVPLPIQKRDASTFVDTSTQKLREFEESQKRVQECEKDISWFNFWSCSEEKNARYFKERELEEAGCAVSSDRSSARCGDITTDSRVSSENSSITTGVGGFCMISTGPLIIVSANDPRCSGKKIYTDTDPPPYIIPPPGTSVACAAAETACSADPAKNKAQCDYVVFVCRHQSPPGDPGPGSYSGPPPGNYGNPSSGQPSRNPYGYNGLSPQDQQMLERQCFDYGNSSACSALQRYCQQSQNQNSSLGGIGQYLPIITALLGGGGNFGSFGGGGQMSAQQCANLDKSINNSMCRQYPGTQFTNGRCECPNNGQWDGTKCPATGANSCSQYPGTVLTNGTCQCPSGQQWDGSRCGGGTTAEQLQAELACAPSVADIDETPIAVSWQCRGADTSKGDGFNTNGNKSGSATATLKSEDLNADATNVDLTLTCTKAGNTKTAVCPLEINRPFLVAVATYSKVKRGETTTIGWIAKGMKDGNDACKITSDKHSGFSQTGRNVVLTTPPIQERTTFTIKCTTKGGITKTAQVTVDVE